MAMDHVIRTDYKMACGHPGTLSRASVFRVFLTAALVFHPKFNDAKIVTEKLLASSDYLAS